MKKHKDLLFEKHDQLDRSEQDHEKLLLRYEIKAIIDDLDEPDSQDLHILGLTYYDTSNDVHDIDEAHQYFLESLEKDKKYYMARLYSAHCYHDKGDYEKALSEYLAVDGELLKAEFPIWRYVKLQEQIGYCLHKLGKITEAKQYFQDTLELYLSESYEEMVDPSEVYECLKESDPIYTKFKEIELEIHDSL